MTEKEFYDLRMAYLHAVKTAKATIKRLTLKCRDLTERKIQAEEIGNTAEAEGCTAKLNATRRKLQDTEKWLTALEHNPI